jgi:chemotaxis protein methyltransferase CheR
MTPQLALPTLESYAEADDQGLEIERLLNGIHSRYGYDFSHYSRASLKRRLERALVQTRLANFSQLLDCLSQDEYCFDEFLKIMSITVTEMFRDPDFYQAVRQHVVPVLKTYPFIKIWHAGCATGEEVYSMALLLHEEGFLDRARIYATDFNKHSLDTASRGVYSAKRMDASAAKYLEAGGKEDFRKYYSAGYELAKFKEFLRERITFSYHNLVTDGVFGEMNLICCRNVLIYFDKTLQDQVLSKFAESLRHGGFLCLGNRESLNFTAVKALFSAVDKPQRIYRKCGA